MAAAAPAAPAAGAAAAAEEAALPVLDPVHGEYEKIHRIGEGTYGAPLPLALSRS
jgi:hypothetical protein